MSGRNGGDGDKVTSKAGSSGSETMHEDVDSSKASWEPFVGFRAIFVKDYLPESPTHADSWKQHRQNSKCSKTEKKTVPKQKSAGQEP